MSNVIPASEPSSPEAVRKQIVDLEAAIAAEIKAGALVDALNTTSVRHYFIPGGYARELTIPAGMLLVGKIAKAPCINVVSEGRMTAITEEGRKEITAPATFRSEAGIKRAGYSHTKTVWTTFHVTDHTDIATMDEKLTASSFEEYRRIE